VAQGGLQDQDEPPLLPPQCMGPAEIDNQINRLKDELEVIRAKAHRKYAAYKRIEEKRLPQARSRFRMIGPQMRKPQPQC
jgi:hypothetical protein